MFEGTTQVAQLEAEQRRFRTRSGYSDEFIDGRAR